MDSLPAPVPEGVLDPGDLGAAPNAGAEAGAGGLDFSEPLTPEGKKVIEAALMTYRMRNMGPVEAQIQFMKDFSEIFDLAGKEGSERRMTAEAALMGIVAKIWQEPVVRPDQMFSRPEGVPALFSEDEAAAPEPADMG